MNGILLARADFWRRLNPELHVCDESWMDRHSAATQSATAPHVITSDAVDVIKNRMRSDGYATTAPRWTIDIEMLAVAALRLRAAGIPPSFIIVYDETWALGADAARVMGPVSGGNLPTLDTLCFIVDPADACGFSPHRDRVPDDWKARHAEEAFSTVASTFRADGEARYSTIWVALRDATVDNSCLYFIPKFADPGFFADAQSARRAYGASSDGGAAPISSSRATASSSASPAASSASAAAAVTTAASAAAARPDDAEDVLASNPMHCAMFGSGRGGNTAFQNVRAAPLRAGHASIHTHRTIHWGSAPSAHGAALAAPRVSLSFAFSDPSFEPPYLVAEKKRTLLPFPRFKLRLALASAQIINYSSLAPSDPAGWRAVRGLLRPAAPAPQGGEAVARDDADDAAVELASLRTMHALFLAEVGRFERGYRSEIARKYLAAAQDFGARRSAALTRASASAAASAAVSALAERDEAIAAEEVEEEEDAALEDALAAMLEADEACGGGEFHDDYDVMEREDHEDSVGERTTKRPRY